MGRAHRQRLVQTAFPGSDLGSSDRASTNVREGHWFHSLRVASATELLRTVTRLAHLSVPGFPYRGFHPSWFSHFDPFRSGTRDLFCPGVCPLRVAPADSSPTAPSSPFVNRHSPGFPGCHDARFDLEVFFHTEMLGSSAVLPARELAPLFRFQSSSGTRISTLVPWAAWPSAPSARDVGSLSLDSAETKPSLTSPRLQRLTGEKVWRPSPELAIPLEVSSR